jgi:hypothetical protein
MKVNINDKALTEAQSITIRVAIEEFANNLSEKDVAGYGEDAKNLYKAYADRINEIRKIMDQES